MYLLDFQVCKVSASLQLFFGGCSYNFEGVVFLEILDVNCYLEANYEKISYGNQVLS